MTKFKKGDLVVNTRSPTEYQSWFSINYVEHRRPLRVISCNTYVVEIEVDPNIHPVGQNMVYAPAYAFKLYCPMRGSDG